MKKQKQDLDSPVCKGCPYPSTGFLCGGNDGDCMKTRIHKIKEMAVRGESKNVCD